MKTNVDNPFQATSAEITTQTDVTASRDIAGTVFQNTATKPIFCNITIAYPQNSEVGAQCADVTPPSTYVTYLKNLNLLTIQMPMSFWVLPGYYYKVSIAGAASLVQWIEYS